MAWALQNNIHMIPKSKNPKRISENIKCQEIILSQEEMSEIDSMAKVELENGHWEMKALDTDFKTGLLFDKNYKM